MGLEIRSVKPDEMKQYDHLVRTAFLSPQEDAGAFKMPNEWTLCAFEDGKLATTYAAFPFKMRFNGNPFPVAAVTQVSTLPVYRNRGYLRKVTEAHFQLLYEMGERPIAILLAAQAAIYQRYEYAVVSTTNSYNIEPRYLEFSNPLSVKGKFREIGDDDFEQLVNIYRTFREERNGYLHRSKISWDLTILKPPKEGMLGRVVYEEDGNPLGYIVYTAKSHPKWHATAPDQLIQVKDFAWLTPEAYHAIWDYLFQMRLARNIIGSFVPPDDPLPHMLIEPRMLHATSRDGLLGRIIDVEKAMPGRTYEEESILTFEVLDKMCSWNIGKWELETSGSGSLIKKTDKSPGLRIPVSTLAMLVFGQISATEAARMGRLDVLDHDALSKWDRVMRTKFRPFCPDIF